MPLLPGAWATFSLIFGAIILGAVLYPIQPLDPFLPWIVLALLLWALVRKRVVHMGTVDIPTAPGEKVLLKCSSMRFYVAETMWQRRGGGTGFHLGRRIGRRWYGGASVWSNGSTSRREEYLKRYLGGALLTDRRLFLVDGGSMATRLVIPIRSIASLSMGRRKDRITLAWGTSPRTAVLEFTSTAKSEAIESAARWLGACRELASGGNRFSPPTDHSPTLG